MNVLFLGSKIKDELKRVVLELNEYLQMKLVELVGDRERVCIVVESVEDVFGVLKREREGVVMIEWHKGFNQDRFRMYFVRGREKEGGWQELIDIVEGWMRKFVLEKRGKEEEKDLMKLIAGDDVYMQVASLFIENREVVDEFVLYLEERAKSFVEWVKGILEREKEVSERLKWVFENSEMWFEVSSGRVIEKLKN